MMGVVVKPSDDSDILVEELLIRIQVKVDELVYK